MYAENSVQYGLNIPAYDKPAYHVIWSDSFGNPDFVKWLNNVLDKHGVDIVTFGSVTKVGQQGSAPLVDLTPAQAESSIVLRDPRFLREQSKTEHDAHETRVLGVQIQKIMESFLVNSTETYDVKGKKYTG